MKLGRSGRGATALDQGGFALIAVLALAAMITAFLITIGINRSKAELSNEREDRNIAALRQAKAALITYAASEQWQRYKAQAPDQPGGLPCPDIDPDTNSGDTGVSPGVCNAAFQRVGRFPFSTIGSDDLRDASGERLWYAVSSNFYKTANNVINSDTQGLLTVTGNAPASNVVAIVFAPGPPVQNSFTGLMQDRSAANYNLTASYLEGYALTGADYTYASSPPPPAPYTATSTFNDRLLVITQAELMAAVEPAVAARMERTVKPLLNDYKSQWGGKPYPFPAIFDLSGSGPGNNATRSALKFTGDPTLPQPVGLLPIGTVEVTAATNASPITITTNAPHGLANSDVVRISGVQGNTAANDDWTVTVVDATRFRLNGSSGNGSYSSGGMVMWPYPWSNWSVNKVGGGGRIDNDSCTTVGAPSPGLQCQFRARDDDCGSNDCISNLRFRIQARVGQNAGRSFANLPDVSNVTFGGAPGSLSSDSIAGSLDSVGVGTVTYTATLPMNCFSCSATYNITVTIPDVVVNGALSSSGPNVGWFIANEWYRQAYYALAPDLTPGGNGNCASNPPCLTVKNLPPVPTASCTGSASTDPCRNTNKQALLILDGRVLNGTLRPSTDPLNYLEGANQTASTTNIYEHRSGTPSPIINDRVVIVAP